jgi:DNA-binding protein HU-beta
MNKRQIIRSVAEMTGYSKPVVYAILNATLNGDPKVGFVARCLKKGERVTFTGFGTFSTRQKAAHTGQDPRNGAMIKVAKRRYAAFKAGRALKAALKK